MKFHLILVLIFSVCFMGFGDTSYALNAKLLMKALNKMADDSGGASKHGDEILEQATPKQGSKPVPTHSIDSSGLGAAAVKGAAISSSKISKCLDFQGFPKPLETLVITGDNVNIRSCNSTDCTVIGRVNRGYYQVDALKRENCWVEFQFKNNNGEHGYGFIHEKYAAVE